MLALKKKLHVLYITLNFVSTLIDVVSMFVSLIPLLFNYRLIVIYQDYFLIISDVDISISKWGPRDQAHDIRERNRSDGEKLGP